MKLKFSLPVLGLTGLLLTMAASTAPANAAPQSLSAVQARHLLIRTGFAPTQAEVDRLVGQSADNAVVALLSAAKTTQTIHPPPQFLFQPPPVLPGLLKTREEQQAARREQLREGLALKTWWLQEMITTPAPLAERMTLFWHNHFATSQQKVIRSQAMWQQQQLLRAHALGNFGALLHSVAKSPAMLVYLDGANSRKEAPNENFAREVMELFVLGEASQGGGYTEQDIKEAARAFTGWSVEREDYSFKFRPFFHDNGSKTVLGHTGNLDGDQALDVMLAQPAAARFVVGKLWREFVAPTADTSVSRADLARAADRFRHSGFDIAVALHELLLSDSFWAEDNRGSLIKSPVELVVGTVRQFGFSTADATPLALKTAQLGQNLLAPPNVKGWPGYTDWINATRLLERKRFTDQLLAGRGVGPSQARPGPLGGQGGHVSADRGGLFGAVELKGESRPMAASEPVPSGMAPRPAMRAEFGGDSGPASNQQMLYILGREGALRVADSMARITFDPEQWLSTYGGHADREPDDALKARLAQVLLAAPATQQVAAGTVGVAYLRTLTLDPAYQLK